MAQSSSPVSSYPIGLPDRVLGDGFVIRHGYASENTWYNPGWLHTGEDWYALEGDTAGAGVFAIADGEVVFAGSEYPGLVVIVRHAPNLFSMYGHLDDDLEVEIGQSVARGALVGAVLNRNDGLAPSHLHIEVRTFLTIPEVNGDSPRYGVGCGFRCPPGPGYWPIDAPEHPSALGWRNPTHSIATPSLWTGTPALAEVIVASGAPASVPLAAQPEGTTAGSASTLALVPGERFRLLETVAGSPAGTGTGAGSYRVWYRIALPAGGDGWVPGVRATADEAGSDGRPVTVQLVFVPTSTGA